MIDLLLQIGISNACVALALALLATIVGATARRPNLAYLLWLLVFVKLVTPPVFNIPLPDFSVQTTSPAVHETGFPDAAMAIESGVARLSPFAIQPARVSPNWTALQNAWIQTRPWASAIWILGSCLVVAWSLLRVLQFNRLLNANSRPASNDVQLVAKRLADQLNLRWIPSISTTSARISPLVWWVGGRVRVVIPESLLHEMDREEWQWVLAHELAHVRRKDFLVRWLEWFAVACFWWNPLVWWAQRNLRACEELCCDALVLSRLNPGRHSYAEAILKTVESLVCPAFRPPAMASEINSGGYLERRVVMIMSGNVLKEGSRLVQMCVVGLALVVFPLGLVYGQDFENVEKQLQKSVEKGHLSQEQAKAMMGTLKRMSEQGADRAETRDTDRKTDRDAASAIAHEAIAKAAAEMEKAVKEGKIVQEDMEKRLVEYRKVITERMAQGEQAERRTTRDDYARAAAEMEKMVTEGKAKKEDVERRLAEMRQAIAEKNGTVEEARRTLTREQYAQAAEKMKKMVAEGEAKQEDVERRLVEMRKMMGESGNDAGESRATFTREQYAEAAAKMEKMVAEGKVKREDMDTRLGEMRRIIGESRGDATGKTSEAKDKAKADELRAIAEKIRAAVESGKLSAEDARKKLEALRNGMSDKKPAAKEKADSDVARDYEGMTRRLKMAVESGKITEDEAKARLKAFMDQKAKDKDGAKRDADSKKDSAKDKAKARTDEIVRKIRQAVADGQITKEEAEAKLKAIKDEAKQKKDDGTQKDKLGDSQ